MRQIFKRGKYPRGHQVRCKHCGHSFEEHESPEAVRNPNTCRKNFRYNFTRCKRYGYEPANAARWNRLEKSFQEEEDLNFRMACYEKDAERRAAWGAYAGHVRRENLKDELREFKENKHRTREEIEKFIDERSTGGLYIG